MIPKVIHWCWLSNDPIPPFITACMDTWKKHLPDYQIKLWDKQSFDYSSVPYVAEAIKLKRWAFACDYIRAYALYTEGGIYLDSDVFVRKNFDFALENRAFSAMEVFSDLKKSYKKGLVDKDGNKKPGVRYIRGSQIQAAILGSEKGHPFFRDILEYYQHTHFLKKDGSPDVEMIAPYIYANVAVKYGFKFIEGGQDLDEGLKLYDSNLFAPWTWLASNQSYAVHCCAHSWYVPTLKVRLYYSIRKRILKILNIKSESGANATLQDTFIFFK